MEQRTAKSNGSFNTLEAKPAPDVAKPSDAENGGALERLFASLARQCEQHREREREQRRAQELERARVQQQQLYAFYAASAAQTSSSHHFCGQDYAAPASFRPTSAMAGARRHLTVLEQLAAAQQRQHQQQRTVGIPMQTRWSDMQPETSGDPLMNTAGQMHYTYGADDVFRMC